MALTPLEGIAVLLLDQDINSEGGLASYLSLLGASVAQASDSTNAIQRLDALPKPNVIVCDLDWPDLHDWALWARLQAELQLGQTPVIAMTHENQNLQAASDAGFQAILVKPVQWAKVESAMLNVLTRYLE